MNNSNDWKEYVANELQRAAPFFQELGISLDERQPHLGGERFLMQAVTSVAGPKLALLGTFRGQHVVVKATSDPAGVREIEHERRCRAMLGEINFAYQRFYAPEELLYEKRGPLVVSVQEYIEQESSFLERSLEEQFRFALLGLKIQEGAHATTYGHLTRVARVFPIWGAKEYLVAAHSHVSRAPGLESALAFLESDKRTIEQYSGFLTHSDFVPHNMRIRDGKLYLLDHSSIRFGNKYEGWARFINFMVLYNPPLADALLQYVRDNRAREEFESLKLMRVYRLVEHVAYYHGTLARSDGDLHTLNSARIEFWHSVLEAVLNDRTISADVRDSYMKTRDTLRSKDERERQKGLH